MKTQTDRTNTLRIPTGVKAGPFGHKIACWLLARALPGAILAAVMGTTSVAYADYLGTPGMVTQVKLNEATADDYSVQLGYIMVDEGGVLRKYQWGGAACSGRLLSAANVALLVGTMRSNFITPSYKTGAGQARCIVGFQIG
jgi:hypothetical protein